MPATLIIVANRWIPAPILNTLIDIHRTQPAIAEIIVVGDVKTNADIHIYDDAKPLNLAKARNKGACQASHDWLIFTDADTYYSANLSLFLINPISIGKRRADVDEVKGNPGPDYEVGAAPLIITRKVFFEIGGYHEGYSNYGFEDSDFAHKLDDREINYIDAIGCHVRSIHNLFPDAEWQRGNDNNRALFNARMEKSIEDRIAEDRIQLNQPESGHYC